MSWACIGGCGREAPDWFRAEAMVLAEAVPEMEALGMAYACEECGKRMGLDRPEGDRDGEA